MSRLMTAAGLSTNLPRINTIANFTRGLGIPLTSPVNDDFVWRAQGAATVTDLGGAIALAVPANVVQMPIREQDVPIGSYTIDIAFTFASRGAAPDKYAAGFTWVQSSDQKCVSIEFSNFNGFAFQVNKYSVPGSFDSQYFSAGYGGAFPLYFFRAQDDTVNRISSISADGQNYFPIHSVARTDFMTADKVGFFVLTNGFQESPEMTLVHWGVS